LSETTTIYDVAKSKLDTDARLNSARASLYRFGGIGALAALTGLGIGFALFGYSYVTDGRTQAEKLAAAMIQALEKAQLTTVGEVKIAEGSTVGLAPGGMVSLDPNSAVRIDSSPTSLPGVGNRDVSATPAPNVTDTNQSPQNRVVTQYTTFKTVPFGAGVVVTGWNFDNSNQITPSNQYCYYDESSANDTHVRTDLGTDALIRTTSGANHGVDVPTAFRSCIWFSRTG
jgi:hypothetical protein